MKFLHAADLHLGSALPGFRGRSPGAVPAEVDAPLRAFDNMLELAERQGVDFLVIAGDLYDGEWKDFSTGLYVADRLRRWGKPCFLLRGNHDAASIIPHRLKLPENIREFGSDRCETVKIEGLGVALHGHSFPNRAVPQDLSAAYCPRSEGMFNIGVLHTSAEGAEGHDTYAPCTVAQLAARGYEYWALGHVHQRRELLRAGPWIVFPGNTQGRHAKETGPKGCSVVTVRDGRVAEVRHHDLDVVRWARVAVDLTGAGFLDVHDRLERALGPALDEAGAGRALAARIEVVGETEAHARLRDDAENLLREALQTAVNIGRQLWVERLAVRTAPRREDDAAEPVAELGELRRRFFESLPEAEGELLAELRRLRGEVPHPAREDLAVPEDAAALAELAADAWALVEHRLSAAAGP